MNQWGRIKAKNFIIALTLCVTLINENHTYLAKADDETQSSADSYIERKIKNGKTDTTIHNDKDIKKQAVQFYVRRQNDKEPSHMNDYVDHPGFLVNIDGKTYFDITILNRKWWQSFHFYQKNKELKITTTDEDKDKDTITIRMPINDIKEEIKSRIHINIPSLKYDHHYVTYIVMTNKDKLEINHKNKVNTCDDKECNLNSNKFDENNNVEKNSDVLSNQTLIPEDNVSSKQKKPISQETLKPENQHQLFKDSMGNSNAITTNNHFPMTPSFGNTHTKSKPSHPTQLNPFQSKKDKPNPNFNRDADKKPQPKKEFKEMKPSHHTKTYVILGSLILLALLVLIATYFVNRKSESKK